jgi:hypothetical protein
MKVQGVRKVLMIESIKGRNVATKNKYESMEV